MAGRYYICGMNGSGMMGDPYRPEIADEPGVTTWSSSQEVVTGAPVILLPRYVIAISDPTGALHTQLAYDPESNPHGFDWFEVADDGTVTIHAA